MEIVAFAAGVCLAVGRGLGVPISSGVSLDSGDADGLGVGEGVGVSFSGFFRFLLPQGHKAPRKGLIFWSDDSGS